MENTIYIGEYANGKKISLGGVIELPDSHLKIIRPYIGTSPPDTADALTETIEDKITLILEDKDFWPVICKLDEGEAQELANILNEAIKHKTKKGSKPEDEGFVQFNKMI